MSLDDRKKKHIKFCKNPICEKKFQTTRSWQKFCSKECHDKYWYDNKFGLIKKIEQQDREIAEIKKQLSLKS